MEMLGFFTTQHFYRDTITWQGCQRKYELFSSPSLITTRTALSLSLYLTTVKNLRSWGTELQTSDISLKISDIWNPLLCSTCSSQINARSCLPLVSIYNSALAQLKCLPICHLVIEKMTSHLPRTEKQLASTKTGLAVNFNNPAGGWNISAG